LYVYFLKQGRNGPIKMGVAGSPEDRLANLQVGNPNELHLIGQRAVEGGYREARELEEALHERFSLYRIRGEWFWPTPDLLRTITELSDPPREFIEPDPPVPELTDDERWDELAKRVLSKVEEVS
jgi:hypothetical protein